MLICQHHAKGTKRGGKPTFSCLDKPETQTKYH